MTDPKNLPRSAPELRREAFFYAEGDAALFDVGADLNTPFYSHLHEFAFNLASLLLSQPASGSDGANGRIFLDIGSGTGCESLPILKAFPDTKVIALDLCPPMHDLFRNKAIKSMGEEEVERRIRFLTNDISDIDSALPALRRAAEELGGCSKIDFALSAFTLHHLSQEEKTFVYPALHEALKENGWFINSDLYGFKSSLLDGFAWDHILEWIRTQHEPATTDYPDDLRLLGDRRDDISRKWVEHCEKFNIIIPAESHSLDRDDDPASSGKNSDAEMLLSAGFGDVEIPYRYWQTAVVYARKQTLNSI